MATFAFSGGTASTAGWGQRNRIRFTGTWLAGDVWTLRVTASSGDFTFGAGNIRGVPFNFLMTYGDRVYAANGDFWNFSAISDPTGWEEQNVGAGELNFQTAFGFVDGAVSLGVIQGRVAVFGRRNIQIWDVNPDPTQFNRLQILQNIGTVAPASVQGIGELDLMFLDDTGIRSLKTRETTLNAYVSDLGSPIDTLIQEVLTELSDTEKAAAVAVVDPETKRYWLFLDGNFYVLSNFPSSEIIAWSTYKATYGKTYTIQGGINYDVDGNATIINLIPGTKYEWIAESSDYSITSAGGMTLTQSGEFIPAVSTANLTGKAGDPYTGTLRGQVPFTPEKMIICNGQVYIRSTDGDLILYGGTNKTTFDSTVPTVELPWMPISDPSTFKQGLGMDIAMKGKWQCLASMNPRAASPTEVIKRGSATTPDVLQDSTYDVGHFGYSAQGTHVMMKFVGVASSVEQKLSKVSLLYEETNKK